MSTVELPGRNTPRISWASDLLLLRVFAAAANGPRSRSLRPALSARLAFLTAAFRILASLRAVADGPSIMLS